MFFTSVCVCLAVGISRLRLRHPCVDVDHLMAATMVSQPLKTPIEKEETDVDQEETPIETPRKCQRFAQREVQLVQSQVPKAVTGGLCKDWIPLPIEKIDGFECVRLSGNAPWFMQMCFGTSSYNKDQRMAVKHVLTSVRDVPVRAGPLWFLIFPGSQYPVRSGS